MTETGLSETAFKEALEAVKGGDFDDVRRALENLGFELVQKADPNHWMYYHPLLKSDPLFRYPRNLYRPHGRRRSGSRVTNRDRSQARQLIDALRVEVGLKQQGDQNE